MTVRNVQTAIDFGDHLPSFTNKEEAELTLFKKRDELVQALIAILNAENGPLPDFSVDSLRPLEAWYLDRVPRRRLFGLLPPKESPLAANLAFYWGEVVIRTIPDSNWIVQEFPFKPGRYEIGVSRGLMSIMFSSFESMLHNIRNTRRDSMWRTYQHYFVPNSKITITF